MVFYRTYITHFETPNGYRCYVGKHNSIYPDPKDDPYYGSGRYPKKAVKKYGMGCITKIEWFTHASEQKALFAECVLIQHAKSIHGKACVNIAEGGAYGFSMLYASEERREEALCKLSSSVKTLWSDSEYREKQLSVKKESFLKRYSNEENRIKQKEIMNRIRPMGALSEDHKKKLSESKRKGEHWDKYQELLELWKSTGFRSYPAFRTIAVENGYPDVSYSRMIFAFRDDFGYVKPIRPKKEPNKKPKKEKRVTSVETKEKLKAVWSDPEKRATHLALRRKGEHWDYFDELYTLWVSTGKVGYRAFRTIALKNGYPDAYYMGMVKNYFIKNKNLSGGTLA